MIKLMTTFDGRPAPGGLYDTVTGTYYKACRSQNGGQHPHRFDLGALDAPIVERLKNLECQKIVLELPGDTFEISFADFLKQGYTQTWNDPRFPFERWYCQARHWNADHLVRFETPCKEEQPEPKQKQASLFEARELQVLAQSGRWAR
jgi:hypothetical protein